MSRADGYARLADYGARRSPMNCARGEFLPTLSRQMAAHAQDACTEESCRFQLRGRSPRRGEDAYTFSSFRVSASR
jgi:hypothetical protein